MKLLYRAIRCSPLRQAQSFLSETSMTSNVCKGYCKLIVKDRYILIFIMGTFYIDSGYCFESMFENDFGDEISFIYPKECRKSQMYFSTKIKMTDIA